MNATAQFVRIWADDFVEIGTLQRFEKRDEPVYSIKTSNPAVKTIRGVHVGSTEKEVKEAYKEALVYGENLLGKGEGLVFVPQDERSCYIVFYLKKGSVSEILVQNGFGSAPVESSSVSIWKDFS